MSGERRRQRESRPFSALQRAENSSILDRCDARARRGLSVLFSEPKIPQSGQQTLDHRQNGIFQCSSASRKFLNHRGSAPVLRAHHPFSALQRAENSSIPVARRTDSAGAPFSALQRAENSSILDRSSHLLAQSRFQCSSASRKFLNHRQLRRVRAQHQLSVLFSEPKIPQCILNAADPVAALAFSALQRAENSSIVSSRRGRLADESPFSALQRAENSSMRGQLVVEHACGFAFSALQRAENSSMLKEAIAVLKGRCFQCSSASRKFLNVAQHLAALRAERLSVLFSEPKIPQSRA